MGIARGDEYAAMDEDPDDYRPSSSWLLQVDPDRRTQLSVIRERIAAGDQIPRHWHDVDEVVLYEEGRALVHLDGLDTEVAPGDTVFIPAGSVHGTRNIGTGPVVIRAVYPATRVRMDCVERNPMPGTEDRAPMATVYDMATGEFTAIGATDLPPAYRTGDRGLGGSP